MYLNIPLNPGDMVETGSFPVHVGIYLGNGLFLHNSKGNRCVQQTDSVGFSGGKEIRLRSPFTGSYFELQQTIQRANSLIGLPYDVVKFNCEHAAYYAREGKTRSPQVALALLGLVLVGGLILTNRQG